MFNIVAVTVVTLFMTLKALSLKCYSSNGLWTNENLLEGLCEGKYCWHAYNMRGDEVRIAYKHCADRSIWSSAGDFHGCIGRRTEGSMMAYDCQCRDRDFCNGNFSKQLQTRMVSYSPLNNFEFERITAAQNRLTTADPPGNLIINPTTTNVADTTAIDSPKITSSVCNNRGKSQCLCNKGFSGSSCETEVSTAESLLIQRCFYNTVSGGKSSGCESHLICIPDEIACWNGDRGCSQAAGWCLPLSAQYQRFLKSPGANPS